MKQINSKTDFANKAKKVKKDQLLCLGLCNTTPFREESLEIIREFHCKQLVRLEPHQQHKKEVDHNV